MRSTNLLLLLAGLVAEAALISAASVHSAEVVDLFKRQQGQAITFPPSGATPPASMTPQAWLDALHAADAAGLIPKVPQSLSRNGPCNYPSGVNPADVSVCSWTLGKCEGKNDLIHAPRGQMAMNFDDGPAEGSVALLKFLEQNNQQATHFLIGGQIVDNPGTFDQIAHSATPQHLAVHTWSHPPCITSLSNEDVLAELGWTMQIIYSRSGKMPKYWRAPQGDVDSRVRAIAENVFNLTIASWNGDSNDWQIGNGWTAEQACANIRQGVQSALAQNVGPMILEHELRQSTVDVFTSCTWPLLHQNNLKAVTVGELTPAGWYASASQTNVLAPQRGATPAPASSSSSSSSASTSISTSSSISSASNPAISSPAPSVVTAHSAAAASLSSTSSAALLLGAVAAAAAALFA